MPKRKAVHTQDDHKNPCLKQLEATKLVYAYLVQRLLALYPGLIHQVSRDHSAAA